MIRARANAGGCLLSMQVHWPEIQCDQSRAMVLTARAGHGLSARKCNCRATGRVRAPLCARSARTKCTGAAMRALVGTQAVVSVNYGWRRRRGQPLACASDRWSSHTSDQVVVVARLAD